MGFTLQLLFTGLCAFVAHPKGKRMRVVLVDASQPLPGHGGHDHGEHDPVAPEPHLPVLVYKTGDLASPRPADVKFKHADTFGLCPLMGMDLEIQGAKPDALKVTKASTAQCPTVQSRTSLTWLANLGQMGRGTGEIDDRCLAASRVHPAVAARVLLTEGTLGTRYLSGNQALRPVLYEFGRPGEGRPQGRRAIAEIVLLELRVATPTITFTTRSFRRGVQSPGTVVLKPQSPSPNARLVAYVKNMPMLDITYQRPPMGPIDFGKLRPIDHHFAHFNRLLRNPAPDGQEPLPIPMALCTEPQPQPPNVGNPQCPGAATPPNPKA